MQQSCRSWLSLSASRNSRLLLRQNVHHFVYNSTPLDPLLSQMNPVTNITTYFHKINVNITTTPPHSPISPNLPNMSSLPVYQPEYNMQLSALHAC
jgi:hypothetical protein